MRNPTRRGSVFGGDFAPAMRQPVSGKVLVGSECLAALTRDKGVGGTRPSDIAISGQSVSEAAAMGTTIGVLSATSVGHRVVWSLVDDAGGKVWLSGGDAAEDNNRLEVGAVSLLGVTSFDLVVRATSFLTGGYTDVVITITVNAATAPNAISIGAPVTAGRFDTVTLSGSNITVVAAAWGAANGLTGESAAEPEQQAYGPAGQNVASFASDNDRINFSGGTMSGAWSAAWFGVCPMNAATSSVVINLMAGSTSNTSNYVQLVRSIAANKFYDRVAIRDDAATTLTNISLSVNLYQGRHYNIVVHYDNSVFRVYVNGALAGTSGSYAAKTFAFTRIGRLNTVNSLTRMTMAAFALWSGSVTSQDITDIFAYGESWRRSRTYVSDSAGDDDSVSFTRVAGTPLDTLAAANVGLFPGDRVAMKRGDVWVNQPVSITAAGLAGAPIVFEAYGTGDKPGLHGTAAWAAAWTETDAVNHLWSTVCGWSPYLILHRTGVAGARGEYTKLRPTGSPLGAWSFSYQSGGSPTVENDYVWDGTNVVAKFPAGVDPNAQAIYIISSNTSIGFGVSAAYVEVYDLSFRYFYGENFRGLNNATPINVHRCESSWGSDDAYSMSATVETRGINFYDCMSYGAGPAYVNSGDGDSFTYHGLSGGALYRCVVYDARRGAIHNEQHTIVLADQCWFEGQYDPIRGLDQGSGSGGFGLTLTNCLIVIDDNHDASNKFAVQIESGVTTAAAVTIESNTFVNKMTDKTVSTGVMVGDGGDNSSMDLSTKFNVFEGFAFGVGISGTGTPTVTEDYNIIHGGAVAGAGVTQGGHSAVADPLFADLGGGDYKLLSGSPCIDAAVGSASTRDRDGRQRPVGSASDIGAYEMAT